MKRKPESKKTVAAESKEPGKFNDLLPPGQGTGEPQGSASPESGTKRKRRKKVDVIPFLDNAMLAFTWRQVFAVISRVTKKKEWELTLDEETQLAEGTNKALSKHLPAWLDEYMEEFSLGVTFGFIVLARLQTPPGEKPPEKAQETPA